jgi:AraC-like DNA-binding protein
LSLVTSFPLGAREPEGAVIVNLDLGRLDEVLEQHRLPITEHVVIENEAGVLLAGGRPREADASVAAVHVADGAEWTYTAYTSKARLRGYLASFRRLTVLLVFGAVIAGALVAYVLALSAYRPFFRLHERFEPFLAGTEGAHDEIDFIEEGLGRTIRRNRELSALIRDNQLSLRSNFLHHLMTGAMQLPARSDLQDRLQLYGVSVDWDAPVVLVVVGLRPEQSGTTRAPEVTKMRAIETVGELAPDAVPFEWSRADVGVLLQSPEGHHGTVALCRQLLTRVGSAEFCAVSETGSGFADLPRLYGQVERALQYRFAMKDEVVFADSFTGARPHLDSQLTDQKRRIVFYMRHGNAAETCAAFEELWRQLDAYRLSTRHWRFVLLELLGAIELEVADLAGTDREDVPADQVELTSTISASYRLLYESDDLSLAPAQFRRIFEVAATLADKSRNSHHHRIVTEAIEFIARNYTRDISLDDVATSVGLSAPYLSKVFSRCKGEGFKEYISRLRVEKAIIMLQTTERPINSIYREIGFTNASTFYRVFKRYAGAAPEAFRVNLSAPPS